MSSGRNHPLEGRWALLVALLVTIPLSVMTWLQDRVGPAIFFTLVAFANAGLALLRGARRRGSQQPPTMQRAAFRGLLGLFLACLLLGVLSIVGAVFASEGDSRPLVGMGILMLGFASLIAIPMRSAWKRRDSSEPWGMGGP